MTVIRSQVFFQDEYISLSCHFEFPLSRGYPSYWKYEWRATFYTSEASQLNKHPPMPTVISPRWPMLKNIAPLTPPPHPISRPVFQSRRKRGAHGGDTHGAGDKGSKARQHFARAGFEGGQTPFYIRIPREDPYKGHHLRRQYPPISLHQLQVSPEAGT